MKNMERIKKASFYLIPLILLIFYIPAIFSNAIWADEAFSVELVQHPFLEIIKIDSTDFHPPLYYLIYRIAYVLLGWMFNNNIVLVGKIVSIIPFVIMTIIGLTMIKKRYGEKTSFIFCLLIAGMPQMMHYALELRMYSYALLFVTLAFIFALDIISQQEINIKKLILLALFSVLSAYTHYFACVACIVIYLGLILYSIYKKDYKKFLSIIISGIGVVILYSPWLFVFVKQLNSVNNGYWIGPISWNNIVEYLNFLFSASNLFGNILAYFILLVAIIGLVKSLKQKDFIGLFGIIIPFATSLIGIILSMIFQPLFVSRYMISGAWCFWLGIAYSLSKIEKKECVISINFLVFFSTIFINSSYLIDEIDNKIKTENNLVNLEKIIDSNGVFVYKSLHVQTVMAVYFEDNYHVSYGFSFDQAFASAYDNRKISSISNLQQLKEENKKIYFVDNYDNLMEEAKDNGFLMENLGSYEIDGYSFYIYEGKND